MRIWDIAPQRLCRAHLLGEHRELHAIWSILTTGKTGYRNHPEVLRWRGKLQALFLRHEALVKEMSRRGFRHLSALSKSRATGKQRQNQYVNTYEEQVMLLRKKGCRCQV